MNDKQEEKAVTPAFINADRRGFLQGAAVTGGVAVTGVGTASDIAVQAETPVLSTQDKGYELNDYVKKYYKRARS